LERGAICLKRLLQEIIDLHINQSFLSVLVLMSIQQFVYVSQSLWRLEWHIMFQTHFNLGVRIKSQLLTLEYYIQMIDPQAWNLIWITKDLTTNIAMCFIVSNFLAVKVLLLSIAKINRITKIWPAVDLCNDTLFKDNSEYAVIRYYYFMTWPVYMISLVIRFWVPRIHKGNTNITVRLAFSDIFHFCKNQSTLHYWWYDFPLYRQDRHKYWRTLMLLKIFPQYKMICYIWINLIKAGSNCFHVVGNLISRWTNCIVVCQ